MKTGIAVAAALIAISTSVNAQRPYFSTTEQYAFRMDRKAERAYVNSLKSPNKGVVESALAHVLVAAAAGRTSDELRTAVREIASRGVTRELRYKAYLTEAVIETPAQYGHLVNRSYEDPNTLFAAVAARLNDAILSSRVQ